MALCTAAVYLAAIAPRWSGTLSPLGLAVAPLLLAVAPLHVAAAWSDPGHIAKPGGGVTGFDMGCVNKELHHCISRQPGPTPARPDFCHPTDCYFPLHVEANESDPEKAALLQAAARGPNS